MLCTTLIAAFIAPQSLWPSTMMKGTPRNWTPYSSEASKSGFTMLPATRTTKRSPGAWSKASSGETRESAQLSIAAIGYCACARAARPDEKSFSLGVFAA